MMSAVASKRGAAGGGRALARATALAPRAALLLVGAAQAEVGIWGLIAPRSFFRSFPGAGHHWVSALGPYNEHLLRDYAAAEVGLAILLVAAAVWFERRLVLVAGGVFLAATVPHFAYHLTTTGHFGTADNVGTLGAFVLELVLVGLAVLAVSARYASRAAPTNPNSGGSNE
jgi:hypothetical protein